MSAQNSGIKDMIRTFLREDPLYAKSIPENLTDDFPLLESGTLDSLGVFNLIVFLESKFGIRVEIEDLSNQFFGNLHSLELFIRSKLETN